jgi:hypothetical protein
VVKNIVERRFSQEEHSSFGLVEWQEDRDGWLRGCGIEILVKNEVMDLKVRLIVFYASFMLMATMGLARRIHNSMRSGPWSWSRVWMGSSKMSRSAASINGLDS